MSRERLYWYLKYFSKTNLTKGSKQDLNIVFFLKPTLNPDCANFASFSPQILQKCVRLYLGQPMSALCDFHHTIWAWQAMALK
jgi:hypothetical protein